MLYSDLILSLRKQVGDLKKSVAADWVADGTTKVLLLPLLAFPVLTGTGVLTRNGVTLTLTTDYTLDLETGRIDVVTLPTNGDIFQFTGMRVALTDEAWIDIINRVIRKMATDFFKEVTDTTTYVTTAAMRNLAITGFTDVYDIGRFVANNVDRTSISNWRFSADENMLYFGSINEFTTSAQKMYIRGTRSYTLGLTAVATLDVQDRYVPVLEYGAVAEYWRYKIRENVENLGKITQDTTRTSTQEIIMVIDRYDRWYEAEYKRLQPAKPPRFIATRVQGKPLP